MKLSLHGVILGQPLSFDELLDLAASLGYEGVDDGFGYALENGADAYLELTSKYGIEASTWGHGVEWRTDEDTFRAGMATLPERAKVAQAIGCFRTCDWIMPAVEGDAAEALSTWKRRWKELAAALGQYGHRFGLEFVGPRHIRVGKNVTVYRMTDLLDIEAELGEPNLGLLLDSFHWFNAEHTVAELEALTNDNIVHVHLNDAPNRSLDGQQDFERLAPGEGIIDLVGFLGALKKTGYDGYMGVEIFSQELKALPNEEAAARVKAGYDAIMAKVG